MGGPHPFFEGKALGTRLPVAVTREIKRELIKWHIFLPYTRGRIGPLDEGNEAPGSSYNLRAILTHVR